MVKFFESPIEFPPYIWFFEVGQTKCGVHRQKGWCIQIRDEVIFCDSEEKCMPLMPILEIDQHMFFTFLAGIKLMNPTYSEAIDTFPKENLIRYVFEYSVSGYWPELALVWVSNDSAILSSLKPALIKLEQNKSLPQSLRHKIKKLAK